jgi:hypothetical protein
MVKFTHFLVLALTSTSFHADASNKNKEGERLRGRKVQATEEQAAAPAAVPESPVKPLNATNPANATNPVNATDESPIAVPVAEEKPEEPVGAVEEVPISEGENVQEEQEEEPATVEGEKPATTTVVNGTLPAEEVLINRDEPALDEPAGEGEEANTESRVCPCSCDIPSWIPAPDGRSNSGVLVKSDNMGTYCAYEWIVEDAFASDYTRDLVSCEDEC